MKPLISLLLFLVQGFASQHHGGVVAPIHNPGRRAPVHTFGYGGYGYGGIYGDYAPFYDYGYNAPASPTGSNVTVVYPPPPPAQVMVTETAHPVIHEYTSPQDYGAAPEANHPILYLIAFRDSNIRAASTYWVEDGTLHYLDTNHQQKQAPLASVDRDLSAQLNRERHVPFNLQ